VGTEKVEEELKKLFPSVKIVRMDLDTTSYKWTHYTLLEKFREGEAQILLGTQMIAKGLDFPNVTLTGVISADIGLNLPDFRAAERTFQLLTQIAGRTGRGKIKGEVVIQTYSPQEKSILYASQHDYEGFYQEEIKERKLYFYPPFIRLALVGLSGKEESRVKRAAQIWLAHLKDYLNENKLTNEIFLLGPAPAPLSKIKGRYRWQIAIKSKKAKELHLLLNEVGRQLQNLDRKIKVSLDIDPIDML